MKRELKKRDSFKKYMSPEKPIEKPKMPGRMMTKDLEMKLGKIENQIDEEQSISSEES
jgi:hypothetical protein